MNSSLRSIGELDRVIHEPSRLLLIALLYPLEEADFLYLLTESQMTKGNLSSHLAKLEEAGYLRIEKSFRGKIPHTLMSLTKQGRSAFERYRAELKRITGTLERRRALKQRPVPGTLVSRGE
jgi:DNA-binding transcriptional ArsR family regulator